MPLHLMNSSPVEATVYINLSQYAEFTLAFDNIERIPKPGEPEVKLLNADFH